MLKLLFNRMSRKFPESIPDYWLRYAYYDELLAGTGYRNINMKRIKKFGEVIFVKEPNNPHDPYAIKAIYGNMHIGYISKNSKMYDMLNDYLDVEGIKIISQITKIDAIQRRIYLQIGYYFSNLTANEQRRQNINLNDDTTVYFTEKGKSYHVSKTCSAFARSKNILNSTLKEAIEKGKTKRCDICS